MADPVTAAPEKARPTAAFPRSGVGELLRRPGFGFRRVYLAVAASELGDAFQYIALMWAALLARWAARGVLAVRSPTASPR